jgi:hypothetical protein
MPPFKKISTFLVEIFFLVFFPLSDKPPIEDLQYFLDFQIAKGWAPEQNNLQRKEPVCQSLQFSLMGPKLYISPDQVCFGSISSSRGNGN